MNAEQAANQNALGVTVWLTRCETIYTIYGSDFYGLPITPSSERVWDCDVEPESMER